MDCPICFDEITAPKLLSCRHSFCKKCLKDYVRKTNIKNSIKCPLCRHNSDLPKGGVSNLIDNYFVATRTKSNSDDSEEEILDRFLSGHVSDDSGDDVTVPLSLLLIVGKIQTKFKATFVSAFSVGEERCINTIYPVSETEVWTISDSGPDLVLFDIYGQELRRLHLAERFCDMVYRRDDILVAMPNDCKIGVVSLSSGQLSDFAFTGHCRIGDLSLFPDGSIVSVGPETVSTKSERRGKIQIFSNSGEYISGHAKDNDDFEPFCVAVNPVLGTYSVVDSRRRCVYTLFRNGDILNIYSGGLRTLRMSESPFIPLGICYDLDGNLIIVDGGSSILHVLNGFGAFMGLILTNHEERFGQPFSVAVDKGGKLWIGDANNGIIRAFRVSTFINVFNDDGE